MAHPPHPRCPKCGKMLFKSMAPKSVKKSDPWAYCRNKDCSSTGLDLSALIDQAAFGVISKASSRLKAKPSAEPEKAAAKRELAEPVSKAKSKPKLPPLPKVSKHERAKALGKAHRAVMGKKLADELDKKTEPEQVTRARDHIRRALALNGEHSKAVVGLTLTILAQEMGGHDIANRLIDEFKLGEQFGIEKRRA